MGQVEGIFWPNPPWWVKKIQHNSTHHISPIQPNPIQPTWVVLGRVEPMGLTIFFITIIIKLSRKKYITFVILVDKQNIH